MLSLLHRVVHPASLVAFPSTSAATAPAFAGFSASAGDWHRAAGSLATLAAGKNQGNSFPQQHSRDTADATAEPAAQRRSQGTDVPWNAAVKAAVLHFWTQQGALLPEAEVQPEQQTERRRRSTILRWAAKYPRHRNVDALTDYMARLREAAAASEWADDPWRIALNKWNHISQHASPASLLRNLQAVKQTLAEHGVCLLRTKSLMLMTHGGNAIAARAVPLLLALDALPISLDFTRVVSKAPTLLVLDNVKAVLQRRVTAMQQLHPQLDIVRVCNRLPSLLVIPEVTLATNWASLQMASGFDDDDMRAAVQYCPGVLGCDMGVVGWKVQQVRAYEAARNLTAVGRTPPSGLSRVLSAASFRVWRLRYLSVVAMNFHYTARIWVAMGEAEFAAWNPGYSLWLASEPIPPEAYQD